MLALAASRTAERNAARTPGVYKKDRKGQLLDAAGNVVPDRAPDKLLKAVHLRDAHLEKGMHCVDCHFKQDNHGDGRIYGEPRPALEIDCADCHGSADRAASLVTSGPASPGTDLTSLGTPFGEPRFEKTAAGILQRSVVEQGREWKLPQAVDAAGGGARRAHSLHPASGMTCYACHSAWAGRAAHCARPLRLRHPGLLAEPEPGVELLAAADGVERRLRGHRVLDLRAAHGPQDRRPAAAPSATSPRATTTMPGWPAWSCRARAS
jgi:hypothetical protein